MSGKLKALLIGFKESLQSSDNSEFISKLDSRFDWIKIESISDLENNLDDSIQEIVYLYFPGDGFSAEFKQLSENCRNFLQHKPLFVLTKAMLSPVLKNSLKPSQIISNEKDWPTVNQFFNQSNDSLTNVSLASSLKFEENTKEDFNESKIDLVELNNSEFSNEDEDKTVVTQEDSKILMEMDDDLGLTNAFAEMSSDDSEDEDAVAVLDMNEKEELVDNPNFEQDELEDVSIELSSEPNDDLNIDSNQEENNELVLENDNELNSGLDMPPPPPSSPPTPPLMTKAASMPMLNEEVVSFDGVETQQQQIDTLRQYVQLKNSDLKVKEGHIQELNSKLEQLVVRYEESEDKRRELNELYEESRSAMKGLEDIRDQRRQEIYKLEKKHDNEKRDIELRLENFQLQARKSDRKLGDFRERVKEDILKIRRRERELFAKLEIQKRDAEALLSSKDEIILEQKRDMDKLNYEIDNLKERLLDETEKAEERIARITRSIQSLRMAEGILSSIEEEIVPAAQDKDVDDDQAA